MSGEADLSSLLSGMRPELHDGVYVFVTLPAIPAGLAPIMIFRETEGWSLILAEAEASAAGLPFEFPCRWITLNIHSSLSAIGFLAAITTKLAAAGMGVNPVSGFFHDHLFVPVDRGEQALGILKELASGA